GSPTPPGRLLLVPRRQRPLPRHRLPVPGRRPAGRVRRADGYAELTARRRHRVPVDSTPGRTRVRRLVLTVVGHHGQDQALSMLIRASCSSSHRLAGSPPPNPTSLPPAPTTR